MKRLPLALMLGPFLALFDTSVVAVSLPSIGTDLDASTSQLQWVVDAYTLLLSALLLSGGALGDRFGRKRVYMTGMAVFTVASGACAVAPSAGLLLVARGVQGGAAALVMTGSLSLLVQAYTDPRKRAEMMGIYGAVGGSAIVFGPVVGGGLTDGLGWPSIFLINLPIGAFALWLTARAVPESSDPEHAALDPVGQVLCLLLLGSLTYGLIESHGHGWTSPVTIGALSTAAVAAVLFVWHERRTSRPMLPMSLFGDAAFTIPNVTSFVLGFGTSAVFFLLSLYLQQVQGHSATSTGLRYLPMTVVMCLTAPIGGRMMGRHGPFRVMIVGYLVSGVSLAGLGLLDAGTGTLTFSLLSVALGVGMGAAITSTQAAGVLALPPQRSGLGSACVTTSRQTGTAMGVAVLGLIVATSAGDDPGAPGYATGFVDGLHVAAYTAAAATLAAALLLLPLLRDGRRERGRVGEPELESVS